MSVGGVEPSFVPKPSRSSWGVGWITGAGVGIEMTGTDGGLAGIERSLADCRTGLLLDEGAPNGFSFGMFWLLGFSPWRRRWVSSPVHRSDLRVRDQMPFRFVVDCSLIRWAKGERRRSISMPRIQRIKERENSACESQNTNNTDITRHRYLGWNPILGNPFSLFIFGTNESFQSTRNTLALQEQAQAKINTDESAWGRRNPGGRLAS